MSARDLFLARLDERLDSEDVRLEIDRCYSYVGSTLVRTHPACDGEPQNIMRFLVKLGTRRYLRAEDEGADELWNDVMERWFYNELYKVSNNMLIYNRRQREVGNPQLVFDWIDVELQNGQLHALLHCDNVSGIRPETSELLTQLRAAYNEGALGEDVVRAAYAGRGDKNFALLRIPILYGRVETLAESPVTELAAKVLEGRPFKAEDWAMRYPAHVDDVARALALIAEQLMKGSPGAGGIYHFASGEQFTKYGMALAIAQVIGADASLITPDPNPPAGAPRPKDCRLDASRLAALGFVPRIRLVDGLREALGPFRSR